VKNFWNGFEKRSEDEDHRKRNALIGAGIGGALGLGAAASTHLKRRAAQKAADLWKRVGLGAGGAITLGSVVGAAKSYRKLKAARRQTADMADSFIKERARAVKDFGHKNTEARSALEKERQLFRDHQKELERELRAAKRMVDKK